MQRVVWVIIAAIIFGPACSNFQGGSSSNQNADAERARQQRQIYQDRAEEKLHELDRQIEDLKTKITTDKHHEHKDDESQLDDLQRKREVAHQKLEKLRTSSSEAWQDMKTGIDEAMDDLSTAFKRADSHFSQ
jgi:uncharacterized protein HemX